MSTVSRAWEISQPSPEGLGNRNTRSPYLMPDVFLSAQSAPPGSRPLLRLFGSFRVGRLRSCLRTLLPAGCREGRRAGATRAPIGAAEFSPARKGWDTRAWEISQPSPVGLGNRNAHSPYLMPDLFCRRNQRRPASHPLLRLSGSFRVGRLSSCLRTLLPAGCRECRSAGATRAPLGATIRAPSVDG